MIRYANDVSNEAVYEPQAVLRAVYDQVEVCISPKMLTEREFGDSANPVGWQLNINRVADNVAVLVDTESVTNN